MHMESQVRLRSEKLTPQGGDKRTRGVRQTHNTRRTILHLLGTSTWKKITVKCSTQTVL